MASEEMQNFPDFSTLFETIEKLLIFFSSKLWYINPSNLYDFKCKRTNMIIQDETFLDIIKNLCTKNFTLW